MRSLAIKLVFKHNQKKYMKEKLSGITFNKIHLLQKHDTYKFIIFNMIIVNVHSRKIRQTT